MGKLMVITKSINLQGLFFEEIINERLLLRSAIKNSLTRGIMKISSSLLTINVDREILFDEIVSNFVHI